MVIAVLVGPSLRELRVAGVSDSPRLLQLAEQVLAEGDAPRPTLEVIRGSGDQERTDG